MQSRQRDEEENTKWEEERGVTIEPTPRRRQVVVVMERRAGFRAAKSKRIPL